MVLQPGKQSSNSKPIIIEPFQKIVRPCRIVQKINDTRKRQNVVKQNRTKKKKKRTRASAHTQDTRWQWWRLICSACYARQVYSVMVLLLVAFVTLFFWLLWNATISIQHRTCTHSQSVHIQLPFILVLIILFSLVFAVWINNIMDITMKSAQIFFSAIFSIFDSIWARFYFSSYEILIMLMLIRAINWIEQ